MQSAAILGGGADPGDVAVVALVQRSTGTLCSGSLIAPQIVLTAAHCVFGVSASDLQVLVGPDVSAPAQTIGVTSTVAYPTYTDEDTGLVGGVDLGAVYLAMPAGVTPLAVSTSATDESLSHAEVTLVGFGVDSTTSSPGAGARRSVTLSVEQVCSRLLTLGGPDGNACFGDSGGAVLLQGALVAVISSGMADCTAPSLQTRLDAHADWIAAVLAGNAASSCATCVAPDPSCHAATETRPANESGDDSGAPVSDATIRVTGGCSVGPARREPGARDGVVAAWMALLTLRLARRTRRRRSP
jgi:secreted trypsin-like serine protease